MLRLQRTDATDKDFIALVSLLDAELTVRDGDDHDFYHQFNAIDGYNYCMVGYQDEQAAGCGAIKPFDQSTVEIKRMYTHQSFRGRGIAIAILAALEAWAKELNYSYCILETGINQPEAIALYQKCGYERIPNFGQYANIENSFCFRKKLIS
ncbi:MAG: GNAT family N-acetyltransferase [Gilvibacter sp.]